MEIRVIASIVAKTEFIEEVKAALHQIIEPSREEKGNLQYDLHTESEQKGSFVFFERWASDEALEKHNKTSLSIILCNCHRIKGDRSGGHRTR